MFPLCDLTLVEMIFVHETLTLIILARELICHLKRERVEVASTLRVWPGLVKNIAGAAGATINRSEGVPPANWLLMF